MLNSGQKMIAEKNKQTDAESAPAENDLTSELNEPRWAVVSFESVVAHGLTYTEAKNRLEELQKQKLSGLCVITDEAAARMLT
jgi:hypothetical protein